MKFVVPGAPCSPCSTVVMLGQRAVGGRGRIVYQANHRAAYRGRLARGLMRPERQTREIQAGRNRVPAVPPAGFTAAVMSAGEVTQ